MTLWWREVWCPYCGVEPGKNCKTKTGRITYAHADRHREGEYMLGGYDEFDETDECPGCPECSDEPSDLEVFIARPATYKTMTTVYLPGDAPAQKEVTA